VAGDNEVAMGKIKLLSYCVLKRLPIILGIVVVLSLIIIPTANAFVDKTLTNFILFLQSIGQDVTITAVPVYSRPPVMPTYQVIYYPTIKYKDGDLRWASQDGATEYMLRGDKDNFPASTISGTLFYQGTALRTISNGTMEYSYFYTLFYKSVLGTWEVAYHYHPSRRKNGT
jgi:hypothetical protein